MDYESSGRKMSGSSRSSLMWGSGVEMKDDWGAISGFMTMDCWWDPAGSRLGIRDSGLLLVCLSVIWCSIRQFPSWPLDHQEALSYMPVVSGSLFQSSNFSLATSTNSASITNHCLVNLIQSNATSDVFERAL